MHLPIILCNYHILHGQVVSILQAYQHNPISLRDFLVDNSFFRSNKQDKYFFFMQVHYLALGLALRKFEMVLCPGDKPFKSHNLPCISTGLLRCFFGFLFVELFIGVFQSFLDSLTVAVCFVADFGALPYQVTMNLTRAALFEITTILSIKYTTCWAFVVLFRFRFS